MPLHLRWELYPIPLEKEKGHHGGSRFEKLDWWAKPANGSMVEEIMEIAREIFALKTIYHNNRGLWYFTWPFHLGLYLLVVFVMLLLTGALMRLAGIVVAGGTSSILRIVLSYLTIIAGTLGWIFGIFGNIGLILMRVVVSKYRNYSLVSDYFNLLLLLGLLVSGLTAWAVSDRSYEALGMFTQALISARHPGNMPTAVRVELVIAVFFFAYLPFTHMTHFMGKFFTFHRVRWQVEPNIAGGKIEKEAVKALGKKVTWSAPHMNSGKTWLEGATGDGGKICD
jgi:nitrate reductase gamma subunit